MKRNPPWAEALRVVQFTDMHLLPHPANTLRGCNTDHALRTILSHITEHELPIDLVLATGDLVHDGPAEAYARLKAYLLKLEAPVHCVPGNHDDPAIMAEMLNDRMIRCTESVDLGNWRIVLLNSVKLGNDEGFLSSSELNRLDAALGDHHKGFALICLHHHPVPVGCAGMDSIGLTNADEFFWVIARHAHVRGILWGHIHHEFTDEQQGVKLLGTPSTCFQFELGSATIGIDDAPPGYRRLLLAADGNIHTDVVRVPVDQG